jgi:hypothetical protein
VQTALFACLVLLFPGNLRYGLKSADRYRQEREALEDDLAAGLPPFAIVLRNADTLFPEEFPERQALLVEALEKLRSLGVRPFQDLPADPAFQKITLETPPPEIDSISRRAFLKIPLKEPQWVYAVGLTYQENVPPSVPKALLVSWKNAAPAGLPKTPPDGRLLLKPPDEDRPRLRTVAVWVNETIDHLRIDWDDQQAEFHIAEIALYVPAEIPECDVP